MGIRSAHTHIDGQVNGQTNEKDEFIAHSLSLSSDDVVALGLQSYTNPLDTEAEVKNEQRIVFYDKSLKELKSFDLAKSHPLASCWIR